MKKSRVVFILNSYSDLNIIKNEIKKNSKIYLFNFLYKNNKYEKNYKLEDFYFDKSNYKNFNKFKDLLCKSWFNINKINFKNKKKLLLIGNILFGRVHSDFTNQIRIAISLLKISKYSNNIFYSSKLPNIFKQTVKYFKNCKQFNSEKSVPDYLLSVTNRSTYHFTPHVHILSNLARNLQYFLSVKKDILVFPDPYYDKLYKKRADTLNLNLIKLTKGFYFKKKAKKNFFFKKQDLDINLVRQNIINIFHKQNFKIDKVLISIFCDCLIRNYYSGIKYFNWTFDNYKELLDHYNPKKIIVTNIISFNYLIANYLAKQKNILSIVSIDGLETVYNPLNILFDKENFIYDKLISYGSAGYNLNLNHKIKKKQLILSKLPATDFLTKNNSKEYEFIIMFFQPRTYNLESRWDKKIFHTIQIVQLLNQLGFKKIAIKIKTDTENLYNETKYLNFLIKSKNLSCKILTGKISDIISKGNNLIGGISTAIWESSYLDIPYYIYEPKDMGLLDYQIKKSSIFKLKQVPRNLSELKLNLLNKNFYRANKKIMFNGKKLNDISL